MRKPLFFFLSVLCLSIISCKKNPANDYANKMSGVHKWHGVYDSSYNNQNGSSTNVHRVIDDSTIEIQVYDNYIVFGSTSMNFESLNNTNHTLRYSLNDPSTRSFWSVTYYYEADSITYRF